MVTTKAAALRLLQCSHLPPVQAPAQFLPFSVGLVLMRGWLGLVVQQGSAPPLIYRIGIWCRYLDRSTPSNVIRVMIMIIQEECTHLARLGAGGRLGLALWTLVRTGGTRSSSRTPGRCRRCWLLAT
jgi:hypothetical protein|eukprot:COSAG01_NODE_1530_length_9964_cov_5.649879_16_plen_127_part_00